MVNLNFLAILIKKELGQVKRDKSVLVIAFLLPIILVLIYGYALRMDVSPVKIAIVSDQKSAIERDVASGFLGSKYFSVQITPDLFAAQKAFENHEIHGILRLDNGFARDFAKGRAKAQLILNGSQAQLAQLAHSYAQGVISGVLAARAKSVSNLNAENSARIVPQITLNSRLWFNEANESSWFLVSGQYVGIITLVSIFIGCIVISREWDRGTMVSLCATSASALEIVLAKVLIYYALSFCSLLVTLAAGEILLSIPIRGSVVMLLLTLSQYGFEMVCLGALISAICKNQFLAQEYALIIGFLPTVLLSGLIFDLRALPLLVQVVGYALPATYVVQAMRICFLSGGGGEYLALNFVIQTFWTVFFFTMAVRRVKKDSK